ncbi:DUF397 domain-containing protein [Streptomyces sp. NPDC058469]|uniref:DUF397 domain-containing protein n=1 Tax=Streptomyces sp. NPDC058469 TaxID=3346514 RepID=UPI00364EECBC
MNAAELRWFKNNYSSSCESGDCVETATTPHTIHVRDSKNISGPSLALTQEACGDFVSYASGSSLS